MSCEYRIFYPLASSGGVATDFNLLDARDLHQLQANAATDSLSPLVEPERTDVYLLDDSMAGMCRYGLKLRGSAAAFDLSSPAASTWALELKVRKSPAPATDEMTDSSSHAATAASVPEDWKKVVRASITCAPSGLLRAILTEVESSAASRADKPQLHAVLTALARDLRDKVAREAAAAVPVQTYRFVSVSKRRTQLPTIGAEQTDVEVRVLPSPDVPVDVSSAAPLRFRSICFEGSRETLTDARIEGLFRHIAQRYPNSDAARTVTAAPRTMGAIVAGYPEFLLRCLAQANVSSSATAAAASSTSVAASASGPPGKRIELKKWSAVSLWSWDIEVDNCAICRNLIMELCIECQANRGGTQSSSGHNDECTVAWGPTRRHGLGRARKGGVCNHAFHFHCITRWLRTRPSCPLDNEDWEFQRYSGGSAPH